MPWTTRRESRRPPLRRLLAGRGDVLLAIAAGGGLGSLARWSVAEALPHDDGTFAWGTFTANVSGALLLGVLMALMADVLAHTRRVRPFLGVGVLGGYTTFSAYMLDARDQLAAGRPEVALAYVGSTLAFGLLAVWVGLVLGRSVIAVAGRRAGHELSDRVSTAPEAPQTRSDR